MFLEQGFILCFEFFRLFLFHSINKYPLILIQFIQTLAQTIGPETMAQFVNSRELITRLAASDGLETYKLIKSEEELMAEEQQQAMMMQQQSQGQDPQNDPAKQAALIKAENDSIRTEQEIAQQQAEGGGD